MRYRSDRRVVNWGLIVLGVIVLLTLAVFLIVKPLYTDTERLTIIKTERVVTDDGNGGVDSKYMVYTEQGDRIYQNTDTLLFFKFNSGELYARLKDGHTYDCTTFGWRISWASQQKNIIDCEEVTE